MQLDDRSNHLKSFHFVHFPFPHLNRPIAIPNAHGLLNYTRQTMGMPLQAPLEGTQYVFPSIYLSMFQTPNVQIQRQLSRLRLNVRRQSGGVFFSESESKEPALNSVES